MRTMCLIQPPHASRLPYLKVMVYAVPLAHGTITRVAKQATDRQTHGDTREYIKKAHKIDLTVASDLTRPENQSRGLHMGPLERAVRGIARGGPIPIVFGAFGETNKELDSLVELCASFAAKTPYGRALSPKNGVDAESGS